MASGERQIAETAERYRRLQERLAQLSITESSGDGAVKVTVSANGLLTDLVLRERWHPEPLGVVAAEIMDCLRRAQARIPELLRQAMFDTVGPDDPSSHLLLADARSRFPQPQPAEPGRPVQAHVPRQPQSPRPDSADDWAEREVMEEL